MNEAAKNSKEDASIRELSVEELNVVGGAGLRRFLCAIGILDCPPVIRNFATELK